MNGRKPTLNCLELMELAETLFDGISSFLLRDKLFYLFFQLFQNLHSFQTSSAFFFFFTSNVNSKSYVK